MPEAAILLHSTCKSCADAVNYRQGEEKLWGAFSLEGGKADNMNNILTTIEHIVKYLWEEYEPDEDIYEAFLRQYEAVRALRIQTQAAADSIRARQDCLQALEQARVSYQKESARREKELWEELRKLEESRQACARQLSQLRLRLEDVISRKEAAQKNRNSLELCLERMQKPCFWAGRKAKEDYRNRVTEITGQLLQLRAEDEAYDRQASECRAEAARCQAGLSVEKQTALQKNFSDWRRREEGRIAGLEKKSRNMQKPGELYSRWI